MNKELVICPACGSEQISRSESESFSQLTLGAEFSFKEINYKCNTCGEEGDFLAETDKNYLASQKEAQNNLVKQMLENMSIAGITMAMFERVLELPARTLTRWKNGDFSSSALALLRIIITYPWIIAVAEKRFEKNFSKCAVITAAAQEFISDSSISSKTHPHVIMTTNDSFTTILVARLDSPQLKSPPTSLVFTGSSNEIS